MAPGAPRMLMLAPRHERAIVDSYLSLTLPDACLTCDVAEPGVGIEPTTC